MLQYRKKSYSKYWPDKWRRLDFSKSKLRLDFNKFSYKNGPKIYSGPSAEARQAFADDKEQYEVWMRLTR